MCVTSSLTPASVNRVSATLTSPASATACTIFCAGHWGEGAGWGGAGAGREAHVLCALQRSEAVSRAPHGLAVAMHGHVRQGLVRRVVEAKLREVHGASGRTFIVASPCAALTDLLTPFRARLTWIRRATRRTLLFAPSRSRRPVRARRSESARPQPCHVRPLRPGPDD